MRTTKQTSTNNTEDQPVAKQTSVGKCNLCNGSFGKSAMSKHLSSCKGRQADSMEPAGGVGSPKTMFHILVEGNHSPEYWMHLDVPANARLVDLDGFLRKTWVECCGHLSAFTIEGTTYSSSPSDDVMDQDWDEDEEKVEEEDAPDEDEDVEDEDDEDEDGEEEELEEEDDEYTNRTFDLSRFTVNRSAREKNLDVKLGNILRPGMQFSYEYDFGSTTALKLKVISKNQGRPTEETVRILARNEPLVIPCSSCGQVATKVCSQCEWNGEGWLCDECASSHKCGEEMLLPVVNSPRVGVCGYTG
jgi:predicted RNA-binding Zn-ribbon protein involved in translation (DUF1610 family)